MSRTRIVGGKITEIVHGDYNIYSASDIIFNSEKSVIPNGKQGVVIGNKVEKQPPHSREEELRITEVKNEDNNDAIPGQRKRYKVVSYNVDKNKVSEEDKKKIKWAIKIEEKIEPLQKKR